MRSGIATRNDVQHEWQKRMKQRVEARSDGRLKVEIYIANQLGTNQTMISGMQLGTVENFIAPGSFFVGVEPRFQVLGAPGLFEDLDHLYRVLRDPEFREAYLSVGPPKGLIGLGIIVYGPTSLVSREPIRRLDDFKGKKIRVFGSPLQTEPIQTLGAAPTPMALSEVLPAFQRRVIDGVLSGLTVFTTFKYYDVSKFLTQTHYSMITSIAFVSRSWFEGLPRDLRTILEEEAYAVEPELYEWTVEEHQRAAQEWAANGGEIIRLPEQDQAKMMQQLSGIGERVFEGEPRVKKLYELLKKRASILANQ